MFKYWILNVNCNLILNFELYILTSSCQLWIGPVKSKLSRQIGFHTCTHTHTLARSVPLPTLLVWVRSNKLMAGNSLISFTKLHCTFNQIKTVHLARSTLRNKWLTDWLQSFNNSLPALANAPKLYSKPFFPKHLVINVDISPDY